MFCMQIFNEFMADNKQWPLSDSSATRISPSEMFPYLFIMNFIVHTNFMAITRYNNNDDAYKHR